MIFIVSTLNERFDPDIAGLLGENVVVVNQGSCKGKYDKFGSVQVINDESFGLSRSRNLGLDYCSRLNLPLPWIICDDDVQYLEGVSQNLRPLLKVPALYQAEIKLPAGESFKSYCRERLPVLKWKLWFMVSSIEMVITDPVLSRRVRFDENFGLGSKNAFGGEECIFVKDWIDSGGEFRRSDVVIGIHDEVSTGSKIDEFEYWTTRKNMFKRLFGLLWAPFYIAFWFKKSSSLKVFRLGARGLIF